MRNQTDSFIQGYIDTFNSTEVTTSNFSTEVSNYSEPTFVLLYKPNAPKNQHIQKCFMKFFMAFSVSRMLSASGAIPPIGDLFFACRHYNSVIPVDEPSLIQKLKLTDSDLPCVAVFYKKQVIGFLDVGNDDTRKDNTRKDNTKLMGDVMDAYIDAGLVALSPMMDSDLDDKNLRSYREYVKDKKMWRVCAIIDAEPTFAFTVGLYHLYGHPEICFAAEDMEIMGHILNIIGNQVKEGKQFLSHHTYEGILGNGFKLAFVGMNQEQIQKYLGTASGFYHTHNFPALMAYFPDSRGLFPWQRGCNPSVARVQLPYQSTI